MSFFFFCKQKTAYEMRISDWSSDVCSSDLLPRYWCQLADWIDDPSAAIADADALEKELLVSSELTGVLKAHRDDPRLAAAAAFAERCARSGVLHRHPLRFWAEVAQWAHAQTRSRLASRNQRSFDSLIGSVHDEIGSTSWKDRVCQYV